MSGRELSAGDWLAPAWAAPGSPVGAGMSVRTGGVSQPPWASFNLGDHVGDRPEHVAANRARLVRHIGATPVFLRQVHGTRVVRLRHADASAEKAALEADASVTTERGLACCVLVADCLPVLLAAPDGRGVAAAHAGWRGLAGGVVEAALQALCEAAACEPAQVRAWLGACIGPQRFEVGEDVLRAFGTVAAGTDTPRFRRVPAVDRAARWLADLPGLTRDRLAAAGVVKVNGGAWCTVEDGSRFFSFRRDGVTGRMAACIWIR
jgi:YfiH family protein